MQRRAVWLAYGAPKAERRDKNLDLHQTRDGGAFGLMMSVLGSLGFAAGPMIFNFPDRKPETWLQDAKPDWLRAEDLVLITTRPPIQAGFKYALPEQPDEGGKKVVHRSNTALEKTVFSSFRKFFDECARDRIELTAEATAALRHSFGLTLSPLAIAT